MEFDEIEPIVRSVAEDVAAWPHLGAVASYIPELADVDPNQFAISVCLPDQPQINFGDYDVEFSVQSVTKVFTLAAALGRYGEKVWDRVGREPSTHAFNSLQDLEMRDGKPPNPFVNAGAIVVADMLLAGSSPKEMLGDLIRFFRQAASDDDIFIDPKVASSEKRTGHKNWALAHYLKAAGNLDHDVEFTLGTYFHQCAISMTCAQLARAGRFLGGIHGATQNMISPQHRRSITALMMTCGHYDASGEFAYRVGIPAKSGVGGGILAVLPGRASIAVWSPGLDQFGNSLRGKIALEALSHRLNWSLFTA